MTIDDQLREIARRADRLQQVITVEEIAQRASRQGTRPFTAKSRFNDDHSVVSYMPVPSAEEEATMIDLEPSSQTDQRHKGPKPVVLAALLAAAVVAIIGATVIAFTANDSNDDHTPAPAVTPAPTTIQPVCPNPNGGTCRGLLAAGTYTTTSFEPAITYTVPDGWINGVDTSRSFGLGPQNTDPSSPTYKPETGADVRYIAIFRDVAIPGACETEGPDQTVGRTIEAMTEWLTSQPGLIATQPEPVEIGGLDGVFIDMRLDPSWGGECMYDHEEPVVAILTDANPGPPGRGWDLTIDHSEEERLYLLQHSTGVIAIDVGADKPFELDPADWAGPTLQELVAMATPILDDIHFVA